MKLFHYDFNQSVCNADTKPIETKRRFRSGEKEAELGYGFAWER